MEKKCWEQDETAPLLETEQRVFFCLNYAYKKVAAYTP